MARLGAAAVLASTAPAQPSPGESATSGLKDPDERIDLWPKGAPRPPAGLVEIIEDRSKNTNFTDRAVHGILNPRLIVFRPKVPNGSALMVAPGGGYRWVVIDKEGYEIGRWLAARGWTVFVLFYRLPGEGWAAGPNVALADAQRAMRLIRARARDYGIVPERVAAMGFSAGGHVCGDLATRYDTPVYTPTDEADRLSARPDLAAPIYAVQSMTAPITHAGSRALLIGKNASAELERAHSPEHNVTPQTPPCFMVHAEDDGVVPVGNTLAFRAALKAAGVPVETHLFEQGGHGFGLRGAIGKPVAIWPDLFVNWARARGLG
jgi:acetyl esterase/lipase